MALGMQTMEAKEQQARRSSRYRIRDGIELLKQEVRLIHWTSPEELRLYTQVVVGATFFFGMGVYGVDVVIHGALQLLSWAVR